MTNHTHLDWNQFKGENTPGTFSLQPVFFQNVQRGYSIVDIGCGAGRICFDLLQQGYEPLIGIDQNEQCIRFANEKRNALPENERKNCCFEKRSALDTGYESESFDVGIMMAVLTTLTTRERRLQALRETRRILRKNGGFYLGEFMQTWRHPVYYDRYLQGEIDTGELGSFLAKDKSGTISFQAHHFSERELVDLIHAADFRIGYWQYNSVATQTGNTVNGVVIWAIPNTD